ncbi:Acyl-CoA N-acyltransferase [Venturia nashicola]|nr:Acyl-CoA N-acyltransferase [Venturia nashicola]
MIFVFVMYKTEVVGYAGWLASVQGKESEQETNAFDADTSPRDKDVDAYKHAVALVSTAQSEMLGEGKRKVWNLASLAVDPRFKGRSIASKLVQFRPDKADRDGLPAYLESTPVAIGLHQRLGFEVIRTLGIIEDNEDYL